MNKANDSDFFMRRKGSADRSNRNGTSSGFFSSENPSGKHQSVNQLAIDSSDAIDDFLSPKDPKIAL